MANQLLARGQATIQTLNDAYTIHQSVSSYVFAAASNGAVIGPVTVTSTIKVLMGDVNITDFTIGAIAKPAGFSVITVNNTSKTITYTVAANTANLPDTGVTNIPVTVAGNTYNLSFAWSKTKDGATGPAGVDANILDWVADWNTNKTVIGTNSVITPKIFAGVKNTNGTITGIALGRFPLSALNASGTVITETVDGVYGFRDGNKTFFIDNGGNARLGRGNQYIKYNAVTGKVEFGSGVSLNWTNAINTAQNAAIAAAAADATNKINSLQIGIRNYIKNSAFDVTGISGLLTVDGVTAVLDTSTKYQGYNTIKITQTAATGTAANTARAYFTALKQCNPASFSMWIKASAATSLRIRTGGAGAVDIPVDMAWKRIKLENRVPTSLVVLFGATTAGVVYNIALPMLVEATKAADWSPAPEDLYGGINNAQAVADAITKKANDEKWQTKLTSIDATGIFTGTLSANTVNAIAINASQITAGTINAARIDVVSLKASLITAANINALTLAVNKGTIGGWSIDGDSIFRGTKNNTSGGYTAAPGAITIGSNGIRGFKWKLDSNGTGAIAGGNISWDASGNVTFGSAVSLNWTNAANNALASAKTYADTKKTEAVNTAATDAATKANRAKTDAINTAATDAANKINALQIGGANLLNNSGNWRTAGWNGGFTSNGGGYTIDNTVLYNGKPALKTLVGTGLQHPWIKLENGAEYTYSAIVKCNETIAGNGNTPLHYHSGLNNVSQGKLTVISHDTSVTAGTWKKIYITFKLTGDADSFRPFFYRGANGTAAYWLAHIKLERGNKATDWTSSASDTTADIADAKTAGVNARTVADAITKKSVDEKWDAKLTYIGATGIFTGTLSANTVNAVRINASQVTAGTIDAARINVAALKTSLITAANIDALTLNVTKGKIGGWTIGAGHITAGSVGATGQMPVQIRSASTGSGYWYNGAYKPQGIVMTWHQSNNAGHFIFGQIAASGNSVKTGFIGIQMMAWDNTEYFCLSANYTKSGGKEVYRQIVILIKSGIDI
ncbi:MAG: hypothetical protein LBV74_04065 [Tannerella sp.]|jgi:hypothetical protein|nr:hypothetical protein [Tannerella sp.]